MKIQIIPHSICNLSCNECYRRKEHIDHGTMTINEFEKIIDILPEVENVDLTPMLGDPLMDTDLFRKLDILENSPKIKHFDFVTNLIEANFSMLQKIMTYSKLGMFVSVYGYDDKSFKQNTNNHKACNYLNFKENLKYLYRDIVLNKRSDFQLGIYMRFFTVDEIFNDLDSSADLYWLIKAFQSVHKNLTIDESTVRKNFNWGGQMKVSNPLPIPTNRSTQCLHSIEQVAIFPGGDVTCCGMVDIHKRMIVGNIFKDGLDVIYKKRYDLCAKCNEYELIQ